MTLTRQMRFLSAVATVLSISLLSVQASAQSRSYRVTDGWAQVPRGLEWGQLIAIDVDSQGNVYAFHRCSASDCIGRSEPPLIKFDPSGKHLMSWGEGMLVWPHGLHIDDDDNIWITDGRHDSGRGQQIIKRSGSLDKILTEIDKPMKFINFLK